LLGVLLRRRVVEARGWGLRVGVVGCVVAGLLVPVLRWWRGRTRGAVGAWYGARRLEALARRRPVVAVAVVGAHVLRRRRHGFVVLGTAWRRAGVAVIGIHELCCLFGFGVSGGGVSGQPFVARPVDVRVSGHDVAQQSSTCVCE
jgi:hypothetical protein